MHSFPPALQRTHTQTGIAENYLYYIPILLFVSISTVVVQRLQKLLLCLSHQRTLATVDLLGKDHDAPVHEWKES